MRTFLLSCFLRIIYRFRGLIWGSENCKYIKLVRSLVFFLFDTFGEFFDGAFLVFSVNSLGLDKLAVWHL